LLLEPKFGPFLTSFLKTSTNSISIKANEPTKIIIITNPKLKDVLDPKEVNTSQLEKKSNPPPKIRQLSIPNFIIKSRGSENNEKKYDIDKTKNAIFNFYNDSGKIKRKVFFFVLLFSNY
jgi:hypothetical protein